MSAVIPEKEKHALELAQESSPARAESDALMSRRERRVADLAYARWIEAGQPAGAWKLYWYEASFEVDE